MNPPIETRYFDFACIITFLIKKGYEIQWEYPYNIGTDFDTLSKYKEADNLIISYFVSGNGVKNQLMRTQVNHGKINGLAIKRSLLIALGIDIMEIEKEDC